MGRIRQITLLAVVFLACEHKKFLNPCDPVNFPSAPQLILPQNDQLCIDNPPHFQWYVEEDTTNPLYGEPLIFELQIDDNLEFSSPKYCDSNIVYETYMPFPPIGDGFQHWRVRTKYQSGFWGDWSETFMFQVKFPLIGYLNQATYGANIAVTQSHAYLSYNSNTLRIMDISDPYAPLYVREYEDTAVKFTNYRIFDNILYVVSHYSDLTNKLVMYGLQNPTLPTKMGEFCDSNSYQYFYDVCVSNNIAYLSSATWYYNFTYVLDISDPDSIVIIDTIEAGAKELSFNNDYLYLLQENRLLIADTTYSLISSIDLSFSAYAFCIAGDYAYIVGNSMAVYDISNAFNPVLVFTLDKDYYAVTTGSNFLFCRGLDNSLSCIDIYDITTRSQPAIAGSLFYIGGNLAVVDNYVLSTDPWFFIIKYE